MMAVLTLVVTASSTLAGQTPATIDPGMTREQVVAKLGTPLSSRSFSGFTYLFYLNGCEKKCGMNDLVVLDSGKVVDAVFRSASRRYSGTSSSPRRITETEAKRGTGAPLKVTAPTQPPKKPTETALH
jgi:outer membrane protein assembly factor BamE (lipoprotein component of BamABCDE complex)